MDKGGPSGDYDASKTSMRDSKTSTLIIEEVYDVRESSLNGIRRPRLNLPALKERSSNAFTHHKRNNFKTISTTDRSDFSSEQTSPNATFGNVNSNFKSTISFDLIKDFQQNSPCLATTENSNGNPFFISARKADFTNNNCDRSTSSAELLSSPEVFGSSPLVKNTYLSRLNVDIEYELSLCELGNNWSGFIGNDREDSGEGALTERCLEIPPKRMKVGLDTPRFSVEQSSVSAAMRNCCANTKDCNILDLHETPSTKFAPNDSRIRNYEFRGCLSAVDGQCETLAEPKPRRCKSKTGNQSLIFDESSGESTHDKKSFTGESLSQICKDMQTSVNLDEDSLLVKEILSCHKESELIFASGMSDISLKSQSTTSYEMSEAAKTESNLINSNSNKISYPIESGLAKKILSSHKEAEQMFPSVTSDISCKSQSTTSYEMSEAAKTEPYLTKVNSNKFSDTIVPDERQSSTYPTVNRLMDDFNEDSNKCSNCQCLDDSAVPDHCSISRPSSYMSCDAANLKITIPSSAEDEDFVNVACLEPNITIIESGKRRRPRNKSRFWQFKHRKDRLGSGDTSATSGFSNSDSQASKSSLAYIVSPVGVEVDSKLNFRMIKKCEKPNVKKKLKSLASKSNASVYFDEKELSVINYSDFCLPIKSLVKLPDEKSVEDVLHTMSQSIFKNVPDAPVVEVVDSIGDCNDLKEDLILGKFSSYSQFKTRAELLAEHLKESEKDKEIVASTESSKIIKEATYPLPPSSSDDNSEANYFLNRRKQQNTQIRFYEIPSPTNSNVNLNRASGECKHGRKESDVAVAKVEDIADDDDDVSTGFCSNCFCKHLLFPKMSRSYFL